MKRRKVGLFKYTVLILILFLGYTLVCIFMLLENSHRLQDKFKDLKLMSTDYDVIVAHFGEPQKITYNRDYVSVPKGEYIKRGNYYSELTYYTNNLLLNMIGYFPFGGTKIIINQDDTVRKLNPYLN